MFLYTCVYSMMHVILQQFNGRVSPRTLYIYRYGWIALHDCNNCNVNQHLDKVQQQNFVGDSLSTLNEWVSLKMHWQSPTPWCTFAKFNLFWRQWMGDAMKQMPHNGRDGCFDCSSTCWQSGQGGPILTLLSWHIRSLSQSILPLWKGYQRYQDYTSLGC